MTAHVIAKTYALGKCVCKKVDINSETAVKYDGRVRSRRVEEAEEENGYYTKKKIKVKFNKKRGERDVGE